ncbi:MAG: phosphoribosylformylglycinamidine synthase subunit PurL [Planctomyces sp.]|nr:phosphoribosylformylglycinamidine synthase subunit PurL [Planctomyces sp.]
MLWEVEIRPRTGETDREGERVLAEARALGIDTLERVESARSFLIEGEVDEQRVAQALEPLLADSVVETTTIRALPASDGLPRGEAPVLLNVLFKPGVTDNVGHTARLAIRDLGVDVSAVSTCRKYYLAGPCTEEQLSRLAARVLANDAIEHILRGPLALNSLAIGSHYQFARQEIPIRDMGDETLQTLSREGQLYLSLAEMRTIQAHFQSLGRDPSDIELETIAQTWSEHCSHKTLRGRIAYKDADGEQRFENLLKETVFAATDALRKEFGPDDWCVSVFRDNAGVVKFNEEFDVCFKVETHNHPSAIEPYGGANTGLGGVIRDPLGTGMGARPVCNTDVFCFAPPDVPHAALPPGVLHPRTVIRGVVAGVRDYGNRMGIPTVNGAVFFDDRYLGNPLVYCGNVAMLPVGKSEKEVHPGDLIVAVGGRTGRDGIHGATFSSAELTHESETLSGGAVQIGNAVVEKMLMDVVLVARDRGLFNAITDCGAGGFSSAVGEMGEQTGAEVWLEKAPLKYSGLSYTEIWISEAQERMVLAVGPEQWEDFQALCASEGVEATVIGKFRDDGRLLLKYDGNVVGDLSMEFLHEGRPPVVREAVYLGPQTGRKFRLPRPKRTLPDAGSAAANSCLLAILGSLNVCSREWIIRQYDHEVQSGSVVKPLIGRRQDGPSDAAVVRPSLRSSRGLVISNGMNPRYGDLDPYWMAASAIDEAVRNCVAVGADPARIAILDNFCWGNTERPETLGTLVRAALACRDVAIAYRTPFISGKDSLNNEFTFAGPEGSQTITIPSSLLISALGQIEDVERAVTMDIKDVGNRLLLVGVTAAELGGSHLDLVLDEAGAPRPASIDSAAWSSVPRVDASAAPRVFHGLHAALRAGRARACHDLSEGGLAVTIAEMAFAGERGAEVQLQAAADAAGLDDLTFLFSESNTRFVLEAKPNDVAAIQAAFRSAGAPEPIDIGRVTSGDRVTIAGRNGESLVDCPIADLRAAWKSPLAWN